MNKKILGIFVMTLLIATAFSVSGCVELNDIKSNISIDKGIASSSTTADYKSFFNRHKEGESNILNKNGNWQWAKGAGGTDYDFGVATTTLSDDSTIVIGSFSDSATFGKGESAETVLVSDGSTDIFVAHYNTDGTIMWAKRAGGTSKDVGQGIVTLSDDSTVVTGSFEGIADFGPYNLTSQGDSDVFVAKLGNQPPVIANVMITTSDPLDTDSPFGWENFTCTVTGVLAVNQVKLVVTYPDTTTEEHPMSDIPDTDTYYCNTTLTDAGDYTYHIWANDTRDNIAESAPETFVLPENWEMNDDRFCDISDLRKIALQFGEMGLDGWIRADYNNDGICDISDLRKVALCFGDTY